MFLGEKKFGIINEFVVKILQKNALFFVEQIFNRRVAVENRFSNILATSEQ